MGIPFRFEWIKSRLSDKDQILDIGCAEGPLLVTLKGTHLEQNVTPLDIDKHSHPRFIRLDAEDLIDRDKSGLGDKTFDVAVLGDILEHVKNPVNVLKGAWRVAKRLLITVPDPSNWHPSLDPYATQKDMLKKTGKSPEQHAKDSNPTVLEFYDGDGYAHLYHRRWYTESALRYDLSHAGFQDYKLERIQQNGWSFFVVEIPDPLVKPNESLTVAKQHPYTRGYFEGDGTGYPGLYRDFVRHWRMIKAIREKKPSSVLDVAGARGYICKHLEAELGIRAVCMDISDHCFHTRATDNFVQRDVRQVPWPFKDKEFDLAISMTFMEHLTEEEIPTVMKETARVSNRTYLTITFEKTPQDIDVTHRTFRPLEWWMTKFKEYAPDYPVEIMSSEEAKKMEQTPIELPQPDGLVKLNIGSWMDMYHYGWENIDSQDLTQFALQNGYVFKQYDVRRGIQKPDNSVDCLLASHLIEHLTRDEGDAFLKECYRVLKPKGILRLAIPDTRLLIGKYVDGSIMEYRHVNVGVEKAPDTAEALFHLLIAGHQTMYDLPSLTAKLKKNGDWKIQKMTAFESQSEAIKKQTVSNFPTLSCYIEGKKLEVKQEISSKAKPKLTSDSQLKIALISTPMLTVFPKNYGGLEDVLGNLGEALAEMGHDVTVFAPNGSKVEGCQVVGFGEPLEKVDVNWLEAERKAYEFYKGMLKDYQIIHGMNWFGMEYAYKFSNPQTHVLHTHHGGISLEYWKRSPPPFKLNLIAISDYMVKVYASQGFTAKRVYNGINLEKYKLQRKKGDRLLFLGRISKIKGSHLAIEVAKKANMGLDVIGATSFVDDSGYVEYVKSLCDGENIRFVGEVNHPTKLHYLQNAKALLVCSQFNEPFGLMTVEALACGTPVIALQDGAIPEILDSKSGFICDNIESMGMAIQQIGLILPENCRKRATLFSRENMARNYLNLFKDILSDKEW